jgi:uncharacterized NAD-dependent epimerase/dehydratase family protein
MPDPKRVVRIAEMLTEKQLIGIGINREKMSPADIIQAKTRYNKIFNVPIVEPLSEGVSDLVDVLEELSNDKK